MNTRSKVLQVAILTTLWLIALARPASAELYLYVDSWAAEYANPDGTGTLYGSATAESDTAELINATMTQKDPNGTVLAYRSRHGQWSITAETEVYLSPEGSPDGTYQAIGTASQPVTGLHIGCNVSLAGKEAYRHHYRLATMGNPNVYRLHEDSYARQCAHTEMAWHQGGANLFMTDQGLYFSFIGRPIACLSVCSPGFWGSVIGPAGNPLGPASCDSPG